MLRKQECFTLRESVFSLIGMIVFLLCFIGLYIFGTLFKGNFWYTEDGVLQVLKLGNPKVEKVLRSKRNVWDYSEIVVKEEGVRKTYFLDTGFLWNYDFPTSKDG
ncbi:MAG: hypothetical protein ACI9BF_000452 [Candidatus Paceibacteria bacterium]|jgi:hypothetical protein